VQAVTVSLTINFLRLPPPADLVAQARLIKVGRRLAVGTVELFSAEDPDMVAHVSGTYSLPPR
jgi:acyl-coenzyme A thioesterase PaaI-like protein